MDYEQDDRICVQELVNGSYEAFDTLYMRYSPLVERFVLSLLKDREEADDVTQNIFLKIWENREFLDPDKSFSSFLYTIARKSYGIDVAEFRDVVLYLMQCTKKELETVMNDEKTPIWVVNIARAISKDAGFGRLSVLLELLDRVFGKPSQAVDVTSNGDSIMPEPITIEVIDRREQIDNDL